MRGNGEGREREAVVADVADDIEEPWIAMVLVTSFADGN